MTIDETSYSKIGYNNDQAGSDGINDVSCPANATSLSQCSFTISNSSDTSCRSNFSDLSITCSNSKFNLLRKLTEKQAECVKTEPMYVSSSTRVIHRISSLCMGANCASNSGGKNYIFNLQNELR